MPVQPDRTGDGKKTEEDVIVPEKEKETEEEPAKE
jgi:hypothetical protein